MRRVVPSQYFAWTRHKNCPVKQKNLPPKSQAEPNNDSLLPRRRKGDTATEFSTHASPANSRVAERVAPQASLAPTRAPLAWGALSERLVPPFLQSVSLANEAALSERLVPPFLQSVSLANEGALSERLMPPYKNYFNSSRITPLNSRCRR